MVTIPYGDVTNLLNGIWKVKFKGKEFSVWNPEILDLIFGDAVGCIKILNTRKKIDLDILEEEWSCMS
jgi:hypothetical protein